jgi:hypothetical protein
LLVGFGLTVFGITAILVAVYLAWRQLARELDDVRKREKARERVYQLMTKDDPEPADEPPSTKRRGHLRVIKVAVPIALLLVWLRDQRQVAALAAGGLAIAAVSASAPLPPLISTPSPPAMVTPLPTLPPPVSIQAPPTMPRPSRAPGETGDQPVAPPTASVPRRTSTVILSATLVPSLPHSIPPPLPPENNDCTIRVLEVCVPSVT